MTSAEALVLPISSGCVLHENFPSVLAKIPILLADFERSGKTRLANVFVTLHPDLFILLRHGALGVAIDSPSTEGVDVSM